MDHFKNTEEPVPKPKRLTPREIGEQLAQAGDFRGLFELLTQTRPDMLDLGCAFAQLYRALDVASANDPAGFADQVFQRMIAFLSYLVLRIHYQCMRSLDRHDQPGSMPGQLPGDLRGNLLPQLREIQGQVIELQQAQASIARLQQLAGKGRQAREEGPAPTKSTRSTRTRRERPGKAATNGTGKNRVRDFLDDLPN